MIEQSPTAGTKAEEGSTVTLSVSSGPGTAKVPDVAGLPERKAATALEERGFLVETEQESSDEIEAGRAVRTEPAAGTKIEGGSTVTLIVSEGTDLAEVPSVVGLSQQIAENQVESAGLLPNVETENSDQPEGTVVAQDPGAGSQIESGSEVTIVVSTGAGTVLVPDVEGLFRDGAVRILTSRGLDVVVQEELTSNPAEDGRVLDQAPEPNQRVRVGDTVTIIVGIFDETAGAVP